MSFLIEYKKKNGSDDPVAGNRTVPKVYSKRMKNLKTLLVAVNAKYIHTNLAVYSLRAFCQPYREQIRLAEYTINQYLDDILMDIYKQQPDVLAISCYIWNIELVRTLGRNLKKVLPAVPIWLGGPEVSFESEEFLQKEPWAEGIMSGEGEQTFYEMMAYYYEDKGTLGQIPGLVFRREDGRIQCNPPGEQLELSQIPFAYENLSDFENKIIYFESSRGCPFSCSYCLSSIDKRVRFRRLELVKQELSLFLEKQVQQVKFVDRTFNCNRAHALAIWRFIKEHDNGVTNFHFEVGADLLGEEELALLSSLRPGQVQLEIGVQSTNMDTISQIQRTMDLSRLEHAVERLRSGGNIHLHLDLIAGLPGEDLTSFQKSFDRVYRMEPDQLQLGFLKVLKGSYMYEKASEYGVIYQSQPPYEVLSTNWISYEEIICLKGVEEMVEMFYNSAQFTHTLAVVVRHYENAFDLYRQLADFYEMQNMRMRNHSRLAQYDFLRDFLRTYFPKQEHMFEKHLLLDLYAREKVKSRPAWATDLDRYKARMRCFYQREEKERHFLPEYDGYNARQLAHMTHIEIFEETEGKERAVLFNYRRRNPKNKEAWMCEVEL